MNKNKILNKGITLAIVVLFIGITFPVSSSPQESDGRRGDNDMIKDNGFSVQQTSDGGFIVAGYEQYIEDGLTSASYASLIKFNNDGTQEWNKRFSGLGFAVGTSVNQTSDNGYIMTGYTKPEGLLEHTQVILIKTDQYGVTTWEKHFQVMDNCFGYSVQQTTDGGYIISGVALSSSLPIKMYNILIKTYSNGTKDWHMHFDRVDLAPSTPFIRDTLLLNSVQETIEGGYIIACITPSLEFLEIKYDITLIKTFANGVKDWSETFDNYGYTKAISVQQTNDLGYIVSGATTINALLLKIDSGGNKLWDEEFPGLGFAEGTSVQQTNDNGYIMTGITANNPTLDSAEILLVKTDEEGNETWSRNFEFSDSSSRGYSLDQTFYGSYVITGLAFNESFEVDPRWDTVLLKVSSAGFEEWRTTFNHPPSTPSNPDPEDGDINVGYDVVLSWNCYDPDGDSLKYDVYFGDTNPPIKVKSNQTDKIYDPEGPIENTTYFWQIVAWDNYNVSNESSIWSFKTRSNSPPYVPSIPNPENGTTEVDPYVVLSWSGGDPDGDPVTYDIYLDTIYPPVLLVYDDWHSTSYDPELDYNMTYYWQIIADDGWSHTRGPIWNFTTFTQPTHVYIDDDYTETTPGWKYDHFNSIQEGIDRVAKDGTINVSEGIYHEQISINKSVNLIGENKFNTIIDGDVGMDRSITIFNTNGTTLRNFTIRNYLVIGIGIEFSQHIIISDTIITEVDSGIFLIGSSNNTISNNLLINNHFGVVISTSSNNNSIYHNNFIDNALQNAYDFENNSWDDGYPSGGNYWDDYNGTDDDGDGIGDIPYNISGPYDSQDTYPFINQSGWLDIPNNPPTANNDTAITLEDIVVSIDVLDNDDDIDGDNLIIVSVSNPDHGSATTDGEYVCYVPNLGYFGNDSFSYVIVDENGGADIASVDVIVIEQNDPPNMPDNPYPTNGATNVNTDVVLSWTGGDPDPGDTVIYDVYLGTDPTPDAEELFSNDQTETTCPTNLDYETTYYWKIVSLDEVGNSTEGPIWSFTTKSKTSPPPPPPPGDRNHAPVADTSGSETSGFVGSYIHFKGSLSYDPDADGHIKFWEWNFGDGFAGSGEITSYTYTSVGTYTVTLIVTDDKGGTGEESITVEIHKGNNPPTNPVVNGTTTGQKNSTYEYTALSTDADNDALCYIFKWGDEGITITEFFENGKVSTQNHAWAAAGRYIIEVYAYDNKTFSRVTEFTVLIDIQEVDDSGYLFDNDSDGDYDLYHNYSTGQETDVGRDDEGCYLLDSDGDGTWDYVYNVETGELTEYGVSSAGEDTPLSEEGEDYMFIIILGVIAVILVIALLYIFVRK